MPGLHPGADVCFVAPGRPGLVVCFVGSAFNRRCSRSCLNAAIRRADFRRPVRTAQKWPLETPSALASAMMPRKAAWRFAFFRFAFIQFWSNIKRWFRVTRYKVIPVFGIGQYIFAKFFLNSLSSNLKAIRGSRSQADFARFLGVPTQVTYHRYENGRIPKPAILSRIAQKLGASVDELLKPLPIDRFREIMCSTMARSVGVPLETLVLTEHGFLAKGETISYGPPKQDKPTIWVEFLGGRAAGLTPLDDISKICPDLLTISLADQERGFVDFSLTYRWAFHQEAMPPLVRLTRPSAREIQRLVLSFGYGNDLSRVVSACLPAGFLARFEGDEFFNMLEICSFFSLERACFELIFGEKGVPLFEQALERDLAANKTPGVDPQPKGKLE